MYNLYGDYSTQILKNDVYFNPKISLKSTFPNISATKIR